MSYCQKYMHISKKRNFYFTPDELARDSTGNNSYFLKITWTILCVRIFLKVWTFANNSCIQCFCTIKLHGRMSRRVRISGCSICFCIWQQQTQTFHLWLLVFSKVDFFHIRKHNVQLSSCLLYEETIGNCIGGTDSRLQYCVLHSLASLK